MFAPIAIWQVTTGRSPLPHASSLLILIAAAISSQLLGNATLQWSFGVVGVAVSIPLCLGTMIVVGVFISKWLLHESLTFWQKWGTLSLVLALASLSTAGLGTIKSVANQKAGGLMIVAGVIAPMVAGVSYAFLSVAIRRGISREVSMFMTISVICAVGILILGPLSLRTTGLEGMAQTTWTQYGVLLLAGLTNAVAFVAFALSFRYAPVIVGNSANSLQNPLSALAGVFLFHERFSTSLAFGVVLTVLGVILMGITGKKGPVAENPDNSEAFAPVGSEVP
ncbi:EamA family transporter [bacterium]|nr:EamA family transporter [bacterium]